MTKYQFRRNELKYAAMDTIAARTLIHELADDLGWLEGYCRHNPDLEGHAGRLRLASSLVRNCIGPYVEGHPAPPLHVAVLGGAGAGKSTVVNFLTGHAAAEANPQAGFTRHPIAFTHAGGTTGWPSQLGDRKSVV